MLSPTDSGDCFPFCNRISEGGKYVAMDDRRDGNWASRIRDARERSSRARQRANDFCADRYVEKPGHAVAHGQYSNAETIGRRSPFRCLGANHADLDNSPGEPARTAVSDHGDAGAAKIALARTAISDHQVSDSAGVAVHAAAKLTKSNVRGDRRGNPARRGSCFIELTAFLTTIHRGERRERKGNNLEEF